MRRYVCWLILFSLVLSGCAKQTSVQEENTPVLSWQEQYDLGLRYLSEGNYEEAIIAFTAAIEIDPKRAPAYAGRGNAYVLSGETEENLTAAQADYEKAIELDKANADAYLGLADVYIRQGNYGKAMEILKQGLEKTGENQKIADKLAEMEKGTFADSQGKARRCNYFEPDGSLSFYDIFQYDSEGNTSRSDHFSSDGTSTGYTIYRNSEDDTHQYQYSDEYDANGNKNSTGLWVGDKDGKWLYSTSINDDGTESLARHVAQYDGTGDCIGWNSYGKDGNLYSYARYKGEQLIYYNADGTVSMYSEMAGRD